MGSAMFTGVTGLLVHQRRLDVIADNIANVNTTGYRTSRVQFQSLFSQTLSGGRAPVGALGGVNPIQVGLGVNIGAIETSFTQSALITTGVPSDLAIQGDGFFILSDGEIYSYTRDGSFALGSNGALVEPSTGQLLQGYMADDTGAIDLNAPIQNLVIPMGTASIVRTTTNVVFTGNLNAGAAVGDTVTRNVRVYDSLGNARDLTLVFTKAAGSNQWDWAVTTTDPLISSVTGSGTITYDTTGNVSAGGTGTITVNFVPGSPSLPTDPFTFTFDFSDTTQLGAVSDVAVFSQDGYPRGSLESFTFGQDGVIVGVFTNGLTRVLGQVALATFPNNAGLVRVGNNQFRESPNSGLPQVGAPSTGARGSVTGGVLETSNVDLGTEFSNLILTQRGFQANARTITAADTLLQEAVNLVR
ncbi:MAG TPA: flagellar hook protein FlgE [Candidatus Hydrogenedentes bacterium]|nr:flagellar hook protein FlgE [Candidatus Hydrogenedentota bacterium]HOL78032.1 flagellar hook protein FlgE [Candidatus Hydrogenedentota bacterium]HPO84609.1 flagellar hook protein FlgE [Candidatus Hydrogenedentota bacterium]